MRLQLALLGLFVQPISCAPAAAALTPAHATTTTTLHSVSKSPASSHSANSTNKTSHHAKCNLCNNRWLFIIATGRSGSSSLFEAINTLPGMRLTGENGGTIMHAERMFYPSKIRWGANAPGPSEHGSTNETDVLCALQNYFLTMQPWAHSSEDPDRTPIRGFKELVVPDATADHIPLDKIQKHVAPFFDKLFPCSKFVFSIRRDVEKQVESLTSMGVTSRDWTRNAATMNRRIAATNSALHEWAEQLGEDRGFVMELEEFSEDKFTELAHWLGYDCKFTHLPHANDVAGGGRYEPDYANSKIECGEKPYTGSMWS